MDSVEDIPASRDRFPDSEICGSESARLSPQLIAACYVLHRLCAPRHPPDALALTLDRSAFVPCPERKPGRCALCFPQSHAPTDALCRKWQFAISLECRIGDRPAVLPANPAIHHVKERNAEKRGDQKSWARFFPHSKMGCSVGRHRPLRCARTFCFSLEFSDLAIGGADRDRTDDLKLAKLALSQLSYGPVSGVRAGCCQYRMVGPGRVERPTSRLSGVRSNHLSYEPGQERQTTENQGSERLVWDTRTPFWSSRRRNVRAKAMHGFFRIRILFRRKEGKRRGRPGLPISQKADQKSERLCPAILLVCLSPEVGLGKVARHF